MSKHTLSTRIYKSLISFDFLLLSTEFKKYSLHYITKNSKFIHQYCILYLKDSTWPLCDLHIKQEIFSLIKLLQYNITFFSFVNEDVLSKQYINFFFSTLFLRAYSIESIRNRLSIISWDIDNFLILNNNDFGICSNLLLLTHPKYIFLSRKKNKLIELLSTHQMNNVSTYFCNTINKICNLQLSLLLSIIFEIKLPTHFFGFRQFKHALHATIFFINLLKTNFLFKSYFLCSKIKQSFNFVLCFKIQKINMFSKKIQKLLNILLRRVPSFFFILKDFLLLSIFFNYLLFLLNTAFEDDFLFSTKILITPRHKTNSDNKETSCIINYTHFFLFKATSLSKINYFTFKFITISDLIGFCFLQQIWVFDSLHYIRISILKYQFLLFTKNNFFSPTISSKRTQICSSFLQTSILKKKRYIIIFIDTAFFHIIKDFIRYEILSSIRIPLFFSLKNVNYILNITTRYFYLESNKKYILYLSYFIDRLFWKSLVLKALYNSVIRLKWIVRTFFFTKKSPLKKSWHYHTYLTSSNYNSNFLFFTYWSLHHKCYKHFTLFSKHQFFLVSHEYNFYLNKLFFYHSFLKSFIQNKKLEVKSYFFFIFSFQMNSCFFCKKLLRVLDQTFFQIFYNFSFVTHISQIYTQKLNKNEYFSLSHINCFSFYD